MRIVVIIFIIASFLSGLALPPPVEAGWDQPGRYEYIYKDASLGQVAWPIVVGVAVVFGYLLLKQQMQQAQQAQQVQQPPQPRNPGGFTR